MSQPTWRQGVEESCTVTQFARKYSANHSILGLVERCLQTTHARVCLCVVSKVVEGESGDRYLY